MSSYKELLKQREALELQISEARKHELTDAIAKARSLVAEFGLTAHDIFPPSKGRARSSTAGSKVAAKYRNPLTGETWTGRGKAPRWIADKDRAQFVI